MNLRDSIDHPLFGITNLPYGVFSPLMALPESECGSATMSSTWPLRSTIPSSTMPP